MSKRRKKLLFNRYERVIQDAKKEFDEYKKQPLFIAGLMLYAGEGDKTTRCHIRLSNTDWRLHEIFIKFLEKYLSFTRVKMHLQVTSSKLAEEGEIKDYWAGKLSIPKENFYKIQKSKGKIGNKLQFGVCMTIINNTKVKYKLMEWVDIYKNVLSK